LDSFNYNKAWCEYVAPEFNRIYPHIRTVYELTALHAAKMSQIGSSHELTGVPDEVLKEFKKLDLKILSHAAIIVYYLGHFSPCKTAQKYGLCWKFRYIAERIIFMTNESILLSEAIRNVDHELDKYCIRSVDIIDYYRELAL
jgi:hypothetical protein